MAQAVQLKPQVQLYQWKGKRMKNRKLDNALCMVTAGPTAYVIHKVSWVLACMWTQALQYPTMEYVAVRNRQACQITRAYKDTDTMLFVIQQHHCRHHYHC